jgi:hypothetical protein
VEFLRTAYAPIEPTGEAVQLDLGYLTGLEEHCYSFERREDGWSKESAEGTSESAGGILALLLGLLVMVSFVVGAIKVLGWLLSVLVAIIGWF